ncbi:hypothetical protein BDV12DRAFT_197040 [Aspergillus spectabilis]
MTSIAARSSLFETSSPLTSFTQWKLTLHEIKMLYIQRQYKRCVARSSSILSSAREPINPVHKTYLYFYSAISYEAMGRYAHVYSRNKVPLLHSALDCFVTCLAVLPEEVPVEEDMLGGDWDMGLECDAHSDGYKGSLVDLSEFGYGSDIGAEQVSSASDFWLSKNSCSISPSPSPTPSPSPSASTPGSGTTSPTESIVSSIAEIIDKTLHCTEDDPFLSDDEDQVDTQDHTSAQMLHLKLEETEPTTTIQNETELHLMPSPLHVRKPSRPLPLVLPTLNFTGTMTAPTKAAAQTQTGIQAQTKTQSQALIPISIPPRLPIAIKPTVSNPSIKRKEIASLNNATKVATHPSPSTASRSTKSYNNSITFLHTQLTTTITSLKSHIDEITTLQSARASSRTKRNSFQRSVSFWSFSPVKSPEISRSGREYSRSRPDQDQNEIQPSSSVVLSSGGKRESIQERIIRLRAEGWETVGLKNETRGWKSEKYYREFCGRALDELYLDV